MVMMVYLLKVCTYTKSQKSMNITGFFRMKKYFTFGTIKQSYEMLMHILTID